MVIYAMSLTSFTPMHVASMFLDIKGMLLINPLVAGSSINPIPSVNYHTRHRFHLWTWDSSLDWRPSPSDLSEVSSMNLRLVTRPKCVICLWYTWCMNATNKWSSCLNISNSNTRYWFLFGPKNQHEYHQCKVTKMVPLWTNISTQVNILS